MKRYRIKYYNDRSKPHWLTEISKSGMWCGVGIDFIYNGKKLAKCKYKNGMRHECWQLFYENMKKDVFINWKKGNRQGMQIKFKI